MSTHKVNDAERLAQILELIAPDGTRVTTTPPSGRGRVWWVEAEHDGHLVSVEWSGGLFGIRTPDEDDYGTAPSEEIRGTKVAALRVAHLLQTKRKARDRREMFLREVRDRRGLSQASVAAKMKLSQANVSQTERRDDMLVSTLREYVEALGGELDIVARFPEGELPLSLRGERR
jgi:hypothetical protein